MNGRKKVIITILIFAVVALLFTIANVIGTSIRTDNTKVTVKALFFNETIEYKDIEDIEIRSDIDYGTRHAGSDFIWVKTGIFSNKEFGNYKCALFSSQKEAIVVKKKDGSYVVFNTKNSDELEDLVNTIKSRMAS
jgi:hypothetical protein